ncbi:sensor histidine kinase [Streptomyces chitinivorans]|uniref:histidine kinase n=1 Tax=Streptomyces chitinivorans TaxID=1257027 RepID=A0ABW7HTZ5_9ACTN|nr:histidine kinase [Streptomyces chitinivorans]MDH2409179.1 histidine kinase [Streptomyces chitinivorans]
MIRLSPGEPVRRGRREWAVDTGAFVLAAVFSVVTSEPVVDNPAVSDARLAADQVAGALACAALWLRRRWPVGVALAILPVGVFSHFVAGPLEVALFTVAVHRRPRTVARVTALALVCLVATVLVRPDPHTPPELDVFIGLVLIGGVVGWGLYVRSRRQLLASLYERARRDTREAVAREMHDVLAHRLSLLSVHAGALEYRPDAPPGDVRQAAGVIRESAHQALEELREVIGVLRSDAGNGTRNGAEHPQPTLADLLRLVEETRRAGTPVDLRQETGGAADVPRAVGRTAYRVVQEGLTNARKHAAGCEIEVVVAGGPRRGLTVEVRNRLGGTAQNTTRSTSGPAVPGAGVGLVGLAERVALAGGRLEHGRDGGDFRLRAWLPWRA